MYFINRSAQTIAHEQKLSATKGLRDINYIRRYQSTHVKTYCFTYTLLLPFLLCHLHHPSSDRIMSSQKVALISTTKPSCSVHRQFYNLLLCLYEVHGTSEAKITGKVTVQLNANLTPAGKQPVWICTFNRACGCVYRHTRTPPVICHR